MLSIGHLSALEIANMKHTREISGVYRLVTLDILPLKLLYVTKLINLCSITQLHRWRSLASHAH